MFKLTKILCLILLLILFSCSEYKIAKINPKKYNPQDTAIVNINNPAEVYNYNWGDSTLVNIESNNGKWVGLIQWKNVGVCSRNSILQPIEFTLDKKVNTIIKSNNYDTLTVDSNLPQIKLHKNYLYIWYMNNRERILRKIPANGEKVENFKFQPSSNDIFAIDKKGNFYFTDFNGVTFTLFDWIKNIFSDNINYSPKNPPIGKFNGELKKIDSFGRWNCFDIKEKKKMYKNIFLNYRHILYNKNNLLTVPFNYGFIEKYSLDGKFISSLNLHTISPLFKNIDENKQVQFLDMDIVEDKLFLLFVTNANVLSGITSYPRDKRILIGVAKIDVLEDKMKLDAIYYLLPDDRTTYQPSFEIIDAHTVAMPKEKCIELYKLP